MNIATSQQNVIVIEPLSEEYLDQSVKLLYHSFKSQNPLWSQKSHSQTYIGIYTQENKFHGFEEQQDGEDYIELRKYEAANIQLPALFKIIGQCQKELVDDYIKNVPEKSLYTYYGGVDIEEKSSSVFAQTFIKVIQNAYSQGYKYIYGFATSPRMHQLISGYVPDMKEIELKSDEYPIVNGYKNYFAKFEVFNIQNKNSNPKPSL